MGENDVAQETTYAIDENGVRRQVFGEVPEGWTAEGDAPAEEASEAPKKAPAKKA
jgi:hypothetical protein